jgi:hypothetical protein
VVIIRLDTGKTIDSIPFANATVAISHMWKSLRDSLIEGAGNNSLPSKADIRNYYDKLEQAIHHTSDLRVDDWAIEVFKTDAIIEKEYSESVQLTIEVPVMVTIQAKKGVDGTIDEAAIINEIKGQIGESQDDRFEDTSFQLHNCKLYDVIDDEITDPVIKSTTNC